MLEMFADSVCPAKFKRRAEELRCQTTWRRVRLKVGPEGDAVTCFVFKCGWTLSAYTQSAESRRRPLQDIAGNSKLISSTLRCDITGETERKRGSFTFICLIVPRESHSLRRSANTQRKTLQWNGGRTEGKTGEKHSSMHAGSCS